MLRIVHHNCAGMDIHKKFIAVCIATTDFKGVTSYRKKRFATFNSDLIACRDWLLRHNCSEVCMESTGKYWIPIFNVLEGHLHVVVAKLHVFDSSGLYLATKKIGKNNPKAEQIQIDNEMRMRWNCEVDKSNCYGNLTLRLSAAFPKQKYDR